MKTLNLEEIKYISGGETALESVLLSSLTGGALGGVLGALLPTNESVTIQVFAFTLLGTIVGSTTSLFFKGFRNILSAQT